MCLIFIFMHIYNLNKQDFFEIFTSQPLPPLLEKKIWIRACKLSIKLLFRHVT